MKKKKKGSIDRYAIPLLFTIVVFILVLMQMYTTSSMDKKDNIDILSRKYILKMETEGYLTNDMKIDLLKDLNEAGAININLTGTTMSRVGYGKEIKLSIKCDLEVDTLQVLDNLSAKKEKSTIPVTSSKTSTAKY